MAELQGRPKTLVRRHVLEIKKDTREWLSEELDELKNAFVLGKTARAIGETAKGVLSHPLGFAAVAGPITALLITLFVKPDLEARVGVAGRDFEREVLSMVLGALPVTEEARKQGLDNLLGAIRTMRRLFGIEIPPPPDLQPEGPQGGGGGSG